MDFVFQDDDTANEFINIRQSDYHLDDLDIDDKVMNTIDKAMEQYGDAKLSLKSDRNQWSHIDNEYGINSDKNLGECDQDIKCLSLFEDNIVDTSLLIDDPLTIDNKSNKVSADPTTKITNNSICKVDDTNIAGKLKIDDENQSKTEKQNNEEVKKRGRKPKAKSTDLCDQDSQTTVKKRKDRCSGYSRWGKEKDVQLFQTLRHLCIDQSINIEDFWNDDVAMSKTHEKVLKDLKHKMHWRRRTSAMLQRIKNRAKNQSLSVRQCHLVRKLVIKARKNKTRLVIEDVAHMFPGKSIATIEACRNDYENNQS